MNLPFSKKSNTNAWVDLDETGFDKLVSKLPDYKRLESCIGERHARGTRVALYKKLAFGGKYAYRKEAEAEAQKLLGTLLRHELNCVLQAHYYIGSLAQRGRMGQFHNTLAGETMAPADYGAKPGDSNLEKATRYLIYTSNSLKDSADKEGAPITAQGIKNAIENASVYDPRSELTLRDLHRRCVNQAVLKPTRGTDLQVAYPSTGGAGFLLESTFNMARGQALPPHGDPKWFDLACFLLGAVIRSHGFTDGNGRVGRAAFAAALVKGGLPFAPLKVGAEKLLHGLDKVS